MPLKIDKHLDQLDEIAKAIAFEKINPGDLKPNEILILQTPTWMPKDQAVRFMRFLKDNGIENPMVCVPIGMEFRKEDKEYLIKRLQEMN